MANDNEWPKGYRHAMSQSEHKRWNATHYPGTLQLCIACGEPTGRCEEDSIFLDNHESSLGPLCEQCAEERQAIHRGDT